MRKKNDATTMLLEEVANAIEADSAAADYVYVGAGDMKAIREDDWPVGASLSLQGSHRIADGLKAELYLRKKADPIRWECLANVKGHYQGPTHEQAVAYAAFSVLVEAWPQAPGAPVVRIEHRGSHPHDVVFELRTRAGTLQQTYEEALTRIAEIADSVGTAAAKARSAILST